MPCRPHMPCRRSAVRRPPATCRTRKRAVAPCGTTALQAAGCDELVDDLAGLLTPAEAVLRAVQGDHPDAVIGRVAAGRTADDHVVAGLQRLSGDTLAAELAGT